MKTFLPFLGIWAAGTFCDAALLGAIYLKAGDRSTALITLAGLAIVNALVTLLPGLFAVRAERRRLAT